MRHRLLRTVVIAVLGQALFATTAAAAGPSLIFEWQREYATTGQSVYVKDVVAVGDGIAVLAYKRREQNWEPWLIRLDANGEVTSDHPLEPKDAGALLATKTGRLALASRTGAPSAWVRWLDSKDSAAIWNSKAGEPTELHGLAALQDGGVALVGYVLGKTGVRHDRLWVARLDSSLRPLWEKQWVGPRRGRTAPSVFRSRQQSAVAELEDGSLLIGGAVAEGVGATATVMRIAKDGSRIVWRRELRSLGSYVFRIAPAAGGGAVVSGGEAGEQRLVRIDSQGAITGTSEFSDASEQKDVLDVARLRGNAYVVIGIHKTRRTFGAASESFVPWIARVTDELVLVWQRSTGVQPGVWTRAIAAPAADVVWLVGTAEIRGVDAYATPGIESEGNGERRVLVVERWGYETTAPPVRESFRSILKSSGTAFFVSADGHLVTNHHVIDSCSALVVRDSSSAESPEVTARHSDGDLALLKTVRLRAKRPATFRASPPPRIGETVITYGFPLLDIVSREAAVSVGIVNRSSGMGSGVGNQPGILQISAATQPGSSGSPVLDEAANVLGIVASAMDPNRILYRQNAIPQNVNFAITNGPILSWLGEYDVKVDLRSAMEPVTVSMVAERAREFSVAVECWVDQVVGKP